MRTREDSDSCHGDLDALATVEAQCFPAAEAADKATIQGRLAAYADHFWLLFDGDKLVSFVDGGQRHAGLNRRDVRRPHPPRPQGGLANDLRCQHHPKLPQAGLWPVWCWNRVLADAKAQGRKGLVLTCKDKLVHYYAKFGFEDYGRSESVHGGAVWYEMRLVF